MTTADQESHDEASWEGEERRGVPPAMHPQTLEALALVSAAVSKNADAMLVVAASIGDAVTQQNRFTRRWLAVLTVAVILIGGVVGWGRIEGIRTGNNVSDALTVTNENNAYIAFLVTCLQDENSVCYQTIQAKEKEVRDADRKLMAEEIICYTTGQCPPGMDRNNIPDLRDLPPPEEEGT